MAEIDETFRQLPLDAIADDALATGSGCQEVLVRIHQTRTHFLAMHDGELETSHDMNDLSMSVRVLLNGSWGFAGSQTVTPDSAVRLTKEATALAALSKPLSIIADDPASEP